MPTSPYFVPVKSFRSMLDMVEDPSLGLETALSRLAAIAVGDFPEVLFKLQYVGGDGRIRVEPHFVTPLLSGVIDRFRAVLGNLDVRDSEIPLTDDSHIARSLLSVHELILRSPEEIKGYFIAHFPAADREKLAAVILKDLAVKEVLLLPVRPGVDPFGVVSVSCRRQLSAEEREYWRFLADSVATLYRRTQENHRRSLYALAFRTEDIPGVLVDDGGKALEVNEAARRAFGWPDRQATLRHLGDLRPCLPRREELAFDKLGKEVEHSGHVFLPTRAEGDKSFTPEVRLLPGKAGDFAGAVVRLRPAAETGEFPRLSRRQREVARLIAEGYSAKEIATAIGLSVHTVNYHRNQLSKKLANTENPHRLPELLSQLFLGIP